MERLAYPLPRAPREQVGEDQSAHSNPCKTVTRGDLAGEARVLRWSVAALNSIEVPVLSSWFVDLMGGKGTKPSEALHGWADMRLKQLDGWLAGRRFIATDDFTVADILMTHVLGAAANQDLLKSYANVLAYRGAAPSAPRGRSRSTRTSSASKPPDARSPLHPSGAE